jgi:hypothetical protein
MIIFEEFLKWEQYQKSRDDDVSAINAQIVYFEKLKSLMYQLLKDVRDYQAKYYDQKHNSKSYYVKDKVLLYSEKHQDKQIIKEIKS